MPDVRIVVRAFCPKIVAFILLAREVFDTAGRALYELEKCHLGG